MKLVHTVKVLGMCDEITTHGGIIMGINQHLTHGHKYVVALLAYAGTKA